MVHTLLMVQFFDQCLRLLQVFRIKPFGEPVVDLGQRIGCCLVLALDSAGQLALMLLISLR